MKEVDDVVISKVCTRPDCKVASKKQIWVRWKINNLKVSGQLKDTPPRTNTRTPKLQVIKNHQLKENCCVPKLLLIKYKSSGLKKNVEEVLLDERMEKIKRAYLINRGIYDRVTVVLSNPKENKQIWVCMENNDRGCDRRWGLCCWKFWSEDNTWRGGTYVFWNTLWRILWEISLEVGDLSSRWCSLGWSWVLMKELIPQKAKDIRADALNKFIRGSESVKYTRLCERLGTAPEYPKPNDQTKQGLDTGLLLSI